MFDIHLDCEDVAQSQMCVCVCDKTGTSLSSEGKIQEKGLIFQRNHSVFFMRKNHKQQFPPASLQLPYCLCPLIASFCRGGAKQSSGFDLHSFEKLMNSLEGTGGQKRSSPFVDRLDSIPGQCLIRLLGGDGRIVKRVPAPLIWALPHPSNVSICCQVVHRLVSTQKFDFTGCQPNF